MNFSDKMLFQLCFLGLFLAGIEASYHKDRSKLCKDALMETQRIDGFNKFYDPIFCSYEPTNCDIFDCRLCLDTTADLPNDSFPQNTTLCPIYEPTQKFTPEQESARKIVGISRQDMQLVLESTKGCSSDPTAALGSDTVEALHELCRTYVTGAHSAYGLSMSYNESCPTLTACNEDYRMSIGGGCRFCRLPGKDCIVDCHLHWPECAPLAEPAIAEAVSFTSTSSEAVSGLGVVGIIGATIGAIATIALVAVVLRHFRSSKTSDENNENNLHEIDSISSQEDTQSRGNNVVVFSKRLVKARQDNTSA